MIWYIVILNVDELRKTEREGFEPSVNKSLHSSSNATPWTARPSLLHNLLWKINWVNSEFSYSCSTGTAARGFLSFIGKIPFDLSGRIKDLWKDTGFFTRNCARYKIKVLIWVFPQLKKKIMEEFFLLHNKIKKP